MHKSSMHTHTHMHTQCASGYKSLGFLGGQFYRAGRIDKINLPLFIGSLRM